MRVDSNAWCKDGNTTPYPCPWAPDCSAGNDGDIWADDTGELYECIYHDNRDQWLWYNSRGCLASDSATPCAVELQRAVSLAGARN
ncbi:hypothetical protein SAMN04489730_3849 [Amycolatopsis australiensis]|uniref:Uncharacterized protein n=2 Tax=Amycolatopsis australiensis TaxID=546364 RepID=A0A1K1RRK7_9PSEU|nr:hypothetical protein SAMN04489730_3849 [Amycolatopsis australiensis]